MGRLIYDYKCYWCSELKNDMVTCTSRSIKVKQHVMLMKNSWISMFIWLKSTNRRRSAAYTLMCWFNLSYFHIKCEKFYSTFILILYHLIGVIVDTLSFTPFKVVNSSEQQSFNRQYTAGWIINIVLPGSKEDFLFLEA